jgi:enamine deaminase RidA (YjgF/YER057c/UK114 family)
MLCNDNPGLKYTVEYGGMGVCVPELTTPEIVAALKHIDADAEAMGEAANRYFDAESVEKAVAATLERYMSVKSEG